MDAASVDAAAFDFDGDLSFLDGLECFDLDLLPAEFFLAGPPGKDGGLGLGLGCPDDDGVRESSPDSVVTDGGEAPSTSGDRDDGGEMSDYVSDLERFLMEDDQDFEAKEVVVADEYFLGGHFGAEPAAGAETMGAEEELCPDDDYLLDDYYFAYDVYAEPGAGAAAGIEDAVSAGVEEEKELATNGEYFFGDYNVTDDGGYAEPASGGGAVVDPPSPILEEEDSAAREDEATSSRKRARYE